MKTLKVIISLLELIIRLIDVVTFGISARIVKPQNQQEADDLYDLTHSLLFDPLNITKKDKRS
jgi:hypothetical protein